MYKQILFSFQLSKCILKFISKYVEMLLIMTVVIEENFGV